VNICVFVIRGLCLSCSGVSGSLCIGVGGVGPKKQMLMLYLNSAAQ